MLFWKRKIDRILVYQMGKVGSVSTQVALRKKGLRTIHAHYLWTADKGEYNTSKPGLVEEILKKDKRWKIVSLVREPICRNISAFFQRIEVFYKQWRNYEYQPDMVNAFLNNYEHFWPLVWFDIEMLPLFQIDVYSEKFDHNRGYHIYNGEYADLLVIRLEDFDKVIKQAFKEFVDLKGVESVLSNYTENKTRIAQMYRDFRAEARFPRQYTDWMYNSRYSRHFYSTEELIEFGRRWSHE